MQTAIKQACYEEASALFHEWYGAAEWMKAGACLYWAQVTSFVLERYGLRPCIQAGDMLWRMVPDSQDDGFGNTHFGFLWSPETDRSKASVAMGFMPEIHVWLGLVESQEIVDFSIGGLVEGARLRGIEWQAEKPPLWLWCKANQIPDDAVYHPNREATLCAARYMGKANRELAERLQEQEA